MQKRAQDRLGDASKWRDMYKALPFGRAGKPEEIAHMVAFLASDLSAYTTGTVINIDAGAASKGNAI
jgi:NAD(P)-dependent dehydrogenase (short-subunit alcohol dehydrogenase family)